MPVASSSHIAALAAPKATPGYSEGLEDEQPARFLHRGTRVALVERTKVGRYPAWRLALEHDPRPFTAYEPELLKFSELSGSSIATNTQDDGDETLKLADIAAVMSDAGVPMGVPAVSRQLDAATLDYVVLIAEQVFGRPITREELEVRARDPDSWRRITDALAEFLSSK